MSDTSGIPVADGTKNIKISFYAASTGGTPLATDCGTTGTPVGRKVVFTNGVGSVLIGETTADASHNCTDSSAPNAISATLFDNTALFIGITVEADAEMTPRKRIVATGYSLNADKLDDLETSAVGGSNAFVPVTDSTGNFTLTKNVTVDTTTFFVDATNDRVGIGTASPAASFDVSGAASGSFGGSPSQAVITTQSSAAYSLIFRNVTAGLSHFTGFYVEDGFNPGTLYLANEFGATVQTWDNLAQRTTIGPAATWSTLAVRPGADQANIGGTTTANASTTITGVGTFFFRDIGLGDRISLSSAPATYATVTAISSDTSLTVSAALGNGTSQTINRKSGIMRLENSAGGPVMMVSDLGNVGIGMTAPTAFKLQVAGHAGPDADDTYDLGDNTHRWRDLYLGPATLHIGTSTSDEGTISYDTTTNALQIDTTAGGTVEIAGGSGSSGCSVDASGNFACSGTVAGGGGAAGAFVNGGNSFAGAATLGTNDANSLSLETNNITYLTIASGGGFTLPVDTNWTLTGGVNGLSFDGTTFSVDATNNRVGIGTAAPERQLVIGTSATVGNQSFLIQGQDKSFIELIGDHGNTDDTGVPYVMFRQDYVSDPLSISTIIGGIGTAGQAPDGSAYTDTIGNHFLLGTLDVNAGLQFGTNDAVRMTMLPAGNIGIGTTSPSDVLSVEKNQNGNTAVTVTNTTSGTAAQSSLYLIHDGPGNKYGSFTVTSSGLTASGLSLPNQYQSITAPGLSNGILLATMGTNAPIVLAVPATGDAGLNANTERVRIGGSEVAINDASRDVDFRVETDGNANGIFLDASAETIDLVGGSASTGCSIDVSGNLACTGTIAGVGGAAFVNGGNSFGGAATLGTNDNFNLAFETNNATRMTVDTSGNVGIGDTTPTEGRLVTSSSGTVAYFNSTDATGSVNAVVVNNTSGSFGLPVIALHEEATEVGSVIGHNAAEFGLVNGINLSSASGRDIGFRINNSTEAARITTGGRFTVGTSGAQGMFTVQSSQVNTVPVLTLSGTTPSTPSSFQWTPNANERAVIATGSTSTNSYATVVAATNQAEAAANTLGAFAFAQAQSGKTNPDGFSGIKSAVVGVTEGAGGSTAGFGGALVFNTRADNSTYGERMRIANTGNVGIGTASPTLAKLQINSTASTGLRVDTANDTAIHATSFETSGVAYHLEASGLQTGIGLLLDGGAGALTSGQIAQIRHNAFYNSTATVSGNVLQVFRQNIANTGATLTTSGPLLHIYEDNQVSGGSLTSTNDMIRIAEHDATTGVTLHVTSAGTGPILRVEDDDEVFGNDASPFVIDATGNVGIGTASPGATLEVKDENSVKVILSATSLQQAFINFQGVSGNTDYKVGKSGSTDFAILQGAGNTDVFHINSSGNIGISDSDPANFKLEVGGSVGPGTDNTHDLGSASLRWKTLHVGPGSVVVHNDTTDTNKITMSFSATVPKIHAVSTASLELSSSNGTVALAASNNLSIPSGNLNMGGSTTLTSARALQNITGYAQSSGTFDFASAVTTSLANVANAWNFDSNTLSIDALNNRVGIGTAAPGQLLELVGGENSSIDLKTGALTLRSSVNTVAGAQFGTVSSHKLTLFTANTDRLNILADGSISLNGNVTVTGGNSLQLSGGNILVKLGVGSTGLEVTSGVNSTVEHTIFTSQHNTGSASSWSANNFNVTNNQLSTANTVTGVNVQFTQNTAVAGVTEAALRLNLKQNDSASTDATVAALLDIANNDTATGNQITVTDGLKITGTNITNGLNFSGTFDTNLITSSNFKVLQSGAIVGNTFSNDPSPATSGHLVIQPSAATSLIIFSSANTTSKILVQDSIGATVFDVDTSNKRIGIGAAATTPSSTLDVTSTEAGTNALTITNTALTTGQALKINTGNFTNDSGRAVYIDTTETTDTADILLIETDFSTSNNQVFKIEADGEAFSDVGFTAGAFSTKFFDGSIESTGAFSFNTTSNQAVTFGSGLVTTGGGLTINGALTTAAGQNTNFDSGTLFVDAANNRVGIGTSSTFHPLDIIVPATTDAGVYMAADALTTGWGMYVDSTSNVLTSGTVLYATHDGSYTATTTVSGNVLGANRIVDVNNAGATLTLSGAVASFTDNPSVTAGTLTHTADVVQVKQARSTNTGAALDVTTAGTGLALRINDDGTFTDSTPAFLARGNGTVSIGTTSEISNFNVNGSVFFGAAVYDLNSISFELQTGFHRIAFDDLRFFDWDSAADIITFNDGGIGIGMDPGGYQIQLSSDSAAKPTSGTWTIISDRRLKENIMTFSDGLDVIRQIDPVSYELNGLASTHKGDKGIGVIAQDIKDVAPYTIKTFKRKLNPTDETETELYSFDASALTFVAINAIKELDALALKLDGLGDLRLNGSVRSEASGFAEMMPSAESLEEGEMVVIDTTSGGVRRAVGEKGDSFLLAGIVSGKAGFAAGKTEEGSFPIALSGRTSVRIVGPVEIGDPLTLSLAPGVGVKAEEPSYIVGTALEKHAGPGPGMVAVWIRPGWWNGSATANTEVSDVPPEAIAGALTADLDMAGFSIRQAGRISGINDLWSIDGDGNFQTRGLMSSEMPTDSGPVKAYASQALDPEIVISGSSNLESGQAVIAFEQDARNIISGGTPLRVTVSLTSDEPVGLYIAEKGIQGFTVKQTGGGTSNASFDWIVVARRRGFDDPLPSVEVTPVPEPTPAPEPVPDSLGSDPVDSGAQPVDNPTPENELAVPEEPTEPPPEEVSTESVPENP